MFDIITFGSASRDITVKPKNLTALKYGNNSLSGKDVCFPLGSKIDVDDMTINSGGGGTNTAATFALQGFKTAFLGKVGMDNAGSEIIKELKNFKINHRFVLRTDKKITTHAVVILDDFEDKTILVYRGASELMDKNDIPWSKLKTKWIYLAPLSGYFCDAFEEIMDFALKNKIKIAANPSIAQLSLTNFENIAKKIDVLFLNIEEAGFLVKVPSKNEEDILKRFSRMGLKIFALTKGSEGAVVSDGQYIYRAKPYEDRIVVDATGAGDSFASGFLSGFMRHNGDMEKSVEMGMANAAACLSEIGAKNGLLKKGQKFAAVNVEKQKI